MTTLFFLMNNRLTDALAAIRAREEGQTMAEYAVILAVITVGILAAIGALSGAIQGAIGDVVDTLGG